MNSGLLKKKSTFFWLSLLGHALVFLVFSFPIFKSITPPRVASKEGLMSVSLDSGFAGSPPRSVAVHAPVSAVKSLPQAASSQSPVPPSPIPEQTPEPGAEPVRPAPVSPPPASAMPAAATLHASSVASAVASPGSDAGNHSATGEVTQKASPQYSDNPKPEYPEAARRRGQQGSVLVTVWVSKTGLPTKVELAKSSGYSLLDRTALQTVMKWKFHPGLYGNFPVDSVVEVPIRFQIL